MEWLDTAIAAPGSGMLGGLLLGVAARRGRFCTLGAIEDALYGHDCDRIRMWGVALAIAIAATALLSGLGILDTSTVLYNRLHWNPVASIVGGVTFGYGMAIAGNCGYGALARLGGGDLRSLVIVVVMGVAAYAVIAGPLAPLRIALFPPELAEQSPGDNFGALLGDLTGLLPTLVAFAISGSLLVFALARTDLRRARIICVWGGIVGLAIASGWLATALISASSFDIVPVESHSFTAPLGETLLYMMTGGSGGLSFSVGSVTGVILGAFLGSISRGHFRWEACDDPQELGRQILGGVLMGIGGVLALGCSIGQGLTAFSVLHFSAPVVLVSICVGAALGLRHLISGFQRA